MGNDNKNIINVEANVINSYAKFHLHPPYGFWEEVFFFLENFDFRLPWQPINISDFDKIHVVGRKLLQEHFCKTFVKISAVTQR